jgi:Tfp pilus assembly protein PilV
MHSIEHCPGGRRQRGEMLLEALIAALLLGVLGLGMTYAAARSASSQRIANAQNLAVGALRALLQTQDVAAGCHEGGAAEATLELQLAEGVRVGGVKQTCTVDDASVSVDGQAKSVKVPHMEFRAVDRDKFGSSEPLLLRN